MSFIDRTIYFITDLGFDKHVFYRIKMHIRCLFGKHYIPIKLEDKTICWCCGGKL